MTNNPETMDEEESRTPFEGFVFHQRRALEETGKALEALLPEGFRTHGTNASKEFTEGFRVLIDAAMKEIKKTRSSGEPTAGADDDDEPGAASSTGKAKVKIPVD